MSENIRYITIVTGLHSQMKNLIIGIPKFKTNL